MVGKEETIHQEKMTGKSLRKNPAIALNVIYIRKINVFHAKKNDIYYTPSYILKHNSNHEKKILF